VRIDRYPVRSRLPRLFRLHFFGHDPNFSSGAPASRWRILRQTLRLERNSLMVTINPDGVSVKGCTYIYAPRGQAGEYSALAANPYRGCGHGCAYCYVPNVTKQDRREFD